VPPSPTACNLSVFHKELKNIYEIVPQSPTESPMASPTYIINGFTNGLRTSRSARMSEAWSVGTFTDRFEGIFTNEITVGTLTDELADGSKSLAGFLNFFGANIN
jgi:hypothetical protein